MKNNKISHQLRSEVTTAVVVSSDQQPKRIVKLFCFFVLLLSVSITSCKKFIEIDPPKTSLTTKVVFESDATATAALTGIYNRMIEGSDRFITGRQGITMLSGMLTDEFFNYHTEVDKIQFYENQLSPANSSVQETWSQIYNLIYSANAVIGGLANSSNVTNSTKLQLEGEAKFIRALLHYYLVNLFGDVPYITTTDYVVNSVVTRTPSADVYQMITSDLLDAKNKISDSYITTQRIRPNKSTVIALLARVYAYKENWVNAEAQATTVINNSTTYSLDTLNGVFLKNSKEAIWQIQPVRTGFNTFEGQIFILTSAPGSLNITLASNLLNAFEVGDNRKASWVGSITVGANTYYFPFKYKVRLGTVVTEYLMIFRLAEQYLIRAEARAQQNNIGGAQSDLNAIRNRAGLPNTTANDKASLLLAIEQERRVEFFAEMGHRWFDLKRWNRANAVLGPIKGANWQTTDVLYPIPALEISKNPNLTQNQGY